MTRTVISHFFNEEYLLPWWLAHHKPMFDHGILIDYHSTDRSAEICRELAPDWTLVQSRNAEFSSLEVDFEVEQYEHELSGWKIALNTTEFLYAPPLTAFEGALEEANVLGAWIPGMVMVDPYPQDEPTHDRPLIHQKPFGIPTREVDLAPVYERAQQGHPSGRDRLYHRASFGAYGVGRHKSEIPRQAIVHDGCCILWFSHSPWTPQFRARKKQIQTRIPQGEKEAGFGLAHFVDDDGLNTLWRELAPLAQDLSGRLNLPSEA